MSTIENARIVELRVENVKRIKAVQINPVDGEPMIEITGRNGQGKTSILDAISYALGGKNLQPSKPIREGADSAMVIVDLGDVIVERKWKADGSTVVNLRNKEGAKFSSPQQILDRLVGELTFDPLAFSRMAAKDQVQTIKQVAGLDFNELESLRAGAFTDRTDVGRELKAAQAQLDGMPSVPDDTPDAEVSFAELSADLSKAVETNQGNERVRAESKRLELEKQGAVERVQKLREELEAAEMALEVAIAKVEAQYAAIDLLRDQDVESLQKRLASAEETNRQVRAKVARGNQEAKVKGLQDRRLELTAMIEKYDQQKQEMLEKANLPVPGLSFGEDGVIYNGLPFEQACSSEQLRVSVAIGLALNPRLKVMLVRDGSLLDSAGRAMLAEMAAAAGAQVWMERATDGEAIGVVIEDGEIKAAQEVASVEG